MKMAIASTPVCVGRVRMAERKHSAMRRRVLRNVAETEPAHSLQQKLGIRLISNWPTSSPNPVLRLTTRRCWCGRSDDNASKPQRMHRQQADSLDDHHKHYRLPQNNWSQDATSLPQSPPHESLEADGV